MTPIDNNYASLSTAHPTYAQSVEPVLPASVGVPTQQGNSATAKHINGEWIAGVAGGSMTFLKDGEKLTLDRTVDTIKMLNDAFNSPSGFSVLGPNKNVPVDAFDALCDFSKNHPELCEKDLPEILNFAKNYVDLDESRNGTPRYEAIMDEFDIFLEDGVRNWPRAIEKEDPTFVFNKL